MNSGAFEMARWPSDHQRFVRTIKGFLSLVIYSTYIGVDENKAIRVPMTMGKIDCKEVLK